MKRLSLYMQIAPLRRDLLESDKDLLRLACKGAIERINCSDERTLPNQERRFMILERKPWQTCEFCLRPAAYLLSLNRRDKTTSFKLCRICAMKRGLDQA